MLPVREKIDHTAVRIKFTKTGDLQYISHLDLQRLFGRILVRANVPVWYSEGYSPHPRLVFATPLSVGAQSICEFMDVNIIGTPETIDISDIKEKLSDTGMSGLTVTDVYLPETKFSSITDATYEIRIVTDGASEDMAKRCADVLCEKPLSIIKRTKSGEKETDISPFIRGVSAEYDVNALTVCVCLCADNTNFLNPEYVVKVLTDRVGLLTANPLTEEYSILRTAVLCGSNPFR